MFDLRISPEELDYLLNPGYSINYVTVFIIYLQPERLPTILLINYINPPSSSFLSRYPIINPFTNTST